jgi:hypothetical protein
MTTTHHQPGQAAIRSVLPQDVDFQPFAAFPPGVMLAVVVLPGETPHFHWAKSGEYITQVTALGPISLDYIHPGDDPRH